MLRGCSTNSRNYRRRRNTYSHSFRAMQQLAASRSMSNTRIFSVVAEAPAVAHSSSPPATRLNDHRSDLGTLVRYRYTRDFAALIASCGSSAHTSAGLFEL